MLLIFLVLVSGYFAWILVAQENRRNAAGFAFSAAALALLGLLPELLPAPLLQEIAEMGNGPLMITAGFSILLLVTGLAFPKEI